MKTSPEAEIFAQKLFKELNRARDLSDGKLPSSQWLRITAEIYDADLNALAARRRAQPPKQKVEIGKMTEAEFVAWLEGHEANKGVDVKKEIAKCRFWCQAHGKGEPSRRRIVNWINGADRPILGNYAGKTSDFEVDTRIRPDEWEVVYRKRFAHYGKETLDRNVDYGWDSLDHMEKRAVHIQIAKDRK